MTGESLCQEHTLQRREEDHQHLAHQTQGYRHQEHLVGEQAHLEDRLGLRAAREGVEHVE